MDRHLTDPRTAADGAQGASVRVEGLVKLFGRHRAVDGVDFAVAAGEFLALLGPSGSGKTSILLSIAGFETPSFGEVWIGERRVTDLPANRRNIGVVFQNYALFPHITVGENIAYPLRMRGRSKADQARLVKAALDMVRLDGQADKLPSQLSGGQQQRVAIARALVFQPKLLLMDEPLGALDRRLRQDMQFELKQLQRRLGVTILYVTHDQDEALTMASRIAVLRAGKMEQIGTPQDLYDRPDNAFVADFIGETNLVPARFDGGLIKIAGQGIAGPPGCGPLAGQGQFAVRPERLRVTPGIGGTGLSGVVTEIIYTGGTTLIHVELAPGCILRARVPTDRAAPALQLGKPVTLAWDAEYGRLFPA